MLETISSDHFHFFSVYSCSREALNGTNIKGKIVLCIEITFGPVVQIFEDAFANVHSGGASGLILALYTTDVLANTEKCQGIPCVLIDIDIGFQVLTYIGSQR